MKVIDTLTQEDFHGAFQKSVEQYKCTAAGRGYFKENESFMCVLSIKVPISKSGNLFNDPHILKKKKKKEKKRKDYYLRLKINGYLRLKIKKKLKKIKGYQRL